MPETTTAPAESIKRPSGKDLTPRQPGGIGSGFADNAAVEIQLRRVNARIQQAAREVHLLSTLTDNFEPNPIIKQLMAVDDACRNEAKKAVKESLAEEAKKANPKPTLAQRREDVSWMSIGRLPQQARK